MDDADAIGLADNADMPSSNRRDPRRDEQLTRLIQHGRDREAAELATEEPSHQTEGSAMDPRTQLDQILPTLNRLVEGLDASQLDAPTACDNFTVRGVVEHMVGGATVFAAAFLGETPAGVPEGGDPVAQFPLAMAGLRAAVHSDGALERTIAAPFGEVPGEAFARFVALDGLVHGWDIATATAQPYEPDAGLVAAVDGFARQAISDGMRDGDTFAAAVEPPAGASSIVQLVAFTGRKV